MPGQILGYFDELHTKDSECRCPKLKSFILSFKPHPLWIILAQCEGDFTHIGHGIE